jgi:hypothetical protein
MNLGIGDVLMFGGKSAEIAPLRALDMLHNLEKIEVRIEVFFAGPEAIEAARKAARAWVSGFHVEKVFREVQFGQF